MASTDPTTNGAEKPSGILPSALDRAHQQAFVTSVKEAARLGSVLAIGVVLGLALAWIQGLGRDK